MLDSSCRQLLGPEISQLIHEATLLKEEAAALQEENRWLHDSLADSQQEAVRLRARLRDAPPESAEAYRHTLEEQNLELQRRLLEETQSRERAGRRNGEQEEMIIQFESSLQHMEGLFHDYQAEHERQVIAQEDYVGQFREQVALLQRQLADKEETLQQQAFQLRKLRLLQEGLRGCH